MTAVKKATPAKRALRTVENEPAGGPKTVSFQGREIAVQLPDGDQLGAWRRIFARMENAEADGLTPEQALKLLDRAVKIVDSVIVDEDDRDWLEDGRVDKTIRTQDTVSIVLDTIRAYGGEMSGAEAPNRAARRKKA